MRWKRKIVKVLIDPTFRLAKAKREEEGKAYREYRRKWNENPQTYIVDCFPIHLDLETLTHCNLKCFMCFQSFDPPPPLVMGIELLKRIIDASVDKGLCPMKTQYQGEPLLDLRMAEIIRYAKDRGILEVMFNTNATLLDEARATELIEAGLDKLICSVDGCTSEVYETLINEMAFQKGSLNRLLFGKSYPRDNPL